MATAKKAPKKRATAPAKADVHYHAPLIHVGATRDSVEAFHSAIHDILTIPGVDNSTRVAALSALTTGCAVNGTAVSGCVLSSAPVVGASEAVRVQF